MRQKKIKSITKEVLIEKGILADRNPIDLKNYNKVNLEIGSGKGQFIARLASSYPSEAFIALEKNVSVCYRILEKKEELGLTNLFIILDDASYLSTYLNKESLDYIYLNFSDPWPKSKHHKRRLTANSFLKAYIELLKKDGSIQFRTDHLDFFNDSIEYIKNSDFKIKDIDYNLKESEYMTEYEIKKRKIGKIYQLRGEKIG